MIQYPYSNPSYALKIMPPHRAYAWNTNSRNANTTHLVPDLEVWNAEFWNSIQVLAHSMTNQNNQKVSVPSHRNDGSMAARV
ncbi:hypothetical protein MTR67_043176 [Solanum verrucosum]|uniref:Uncharacterized protein n=1 Tax=Solanum verrucosum TaxID=315347 RepID=A0AAF0UQV4_SOLVR|nr:hypothetical protein MTR67_043176 [Solanum verrucosum]